jgi:predicted outer membrane repeat protein
VQAAAGAHARQSVLRQCYFDSCSAGEAGGAVAVIVNDGSTMSVVVEDSFFLRSKLTSGASSALGGSVIMVFTGTVRDVINVFRNCSFADGIFYGAKASIGGGVYLYYRGATTFNTTSIIEDCQFRNNELHGAIGAEGGGLMVAIVGTATNVTTMIRGSVFEDNAMSVSGARGFAQGAGMVISHVGKVSHVRSIIEGSSFIRNSLIALNGGNGGAIFVGYDDEATDVQTVVHDCDVIHNKVIVPGGTGTGGGVYHIAQSTNVAVQLLRCIINFNVATTNGGALHVEQVNENPPANLEMICEQLPPGSGYADPFVCVPKNAGAPRLWKFGTAYLEIGSTSLIGNRVDPDATIASVGAVSVLSGSETMPAFGGAIHVTNLNTKVDSCAIHNNYAATSGGAIYFEPGSATLTLRGNTTLQGNIARDSGTAIYSSSGGGVALEDEASVELVGDAEASGVAILSGGVTSYGRDARLQCTSGERLLYNVSAFGQSFTDWTIDCNTVKSHDFGTRMDYVNPTCEQMKIPNSISLFESIQTYPLAYPRNFPSLCSEDQCASLFNSSVLFTYPFNNLANSPIVLMTTGTIGCSPCSGGLYSLEHGKRVGDNKTTAIECLPCPYGALCSSGGARIKVKAGFWGEAFQGSKGDGSKVTRARMHSCPRGYCCTNSDDGCPWNSIDACEGNHDRTYPMCGGCLPGFSQAIDGTRCVENIKCGFDTNFVVTQLLCWLSYVIFVLYQTKYTPLIDRLPCQWMKPSGGGAPSSGAVSVVIYFFQLAMVVVPTGYDSLAGQVALAVGQASRVEQFGGGGTCLATGTTPVDLLWWRLMRSFGPLALLVFVHCAVKVLFPKSPRGHNDLGTLQDEPLIPRAEATGASVSVSAAVASLLFLVFASFSEGTLRLLNCVSVGNEHVLFYAGSKACGMRWQLPLYLLLGLLVLLPLLPICLWMLCRLPRSFYLASMARKQRWPVHHLLQAVRRHAIEAFVDQHWHWAAVLILQVHLKTFVCLC